MAHPRLLVIQNEDECPLGWFDAWLADAGVATEVVAAHRDAEVPEALRSHDGLLVLGGNMGANDDDTCRWLPATKQLIAATIGSHHPFLGICLGHQLAAVALGGEVAPNPRGTTRGVLPVALSAAGRADPLVGPHDGDPATHWNSDIVTALPHGAQVLATAPDGTVQAARFGDRAWGVQFHPEASPAIVGGWVVDRPDKPVPGKVIAAHREVSAAEARLRAAWAPLAHRFAALLCG